MFVEIWIHVGIYTKHVVDFAERRQLHDCTVLKENKGQTSMSGMNVCIFAVIFEHFCSTDQPLGKSQVLCQESKE
jgi:hypothetical protein